MPTLDIRLHDGSIQKISYPDGWSDDQVKEAIYKQFPNPEEKREGVSGILQDVGESVVNAPKEALALAKKLPAQAYSAGKQTVNDPLRAIINFGGGIRKGMEGLANTPSNIAEYLNARNIGRGDIENVIRAARIPESDLEERLLGKEQEGDEFLRGLGSFVPYAGIGGTARGLKGLAKRAGASAAYATGQGADPVSAALLGMAGEGAVKGLRKTQGVPSALVPASKLTNEELQAALDQTAGTKTGLGSVIENPFLKKQYENVLPNIPFSGANEYMMRTADDITNRGQGILDNLKGNYDTSDVGSVIKEALADAYKDVRSEKDAKFKSLNEAAKKDGVNTDLSHLHTQAKKILDEINSNPISAALTDSSIKGKLEKIVESGANKPVSLREADILRSELGELASDAHMSDNTKLSRIYSSLKDAAEKDINNTVDNSNNTNLKKLRDEAMDFYKKDYAPFLDSDIAKFSKKGGDPDVLIQSFIKNSPLSDRSRLLEKLTSKLKPEHRDLLTHAYLSANAMENGSLNPLKLRTAYKKLGERQKAALLGHNQNLSKQLKDYSRLVEMNEEPISAMVNPKTGARTNTFVPWAGITGGISALLSGNIPVGLGMAALPIALSRPAAKFLTNEKVRQKVVKKIISSRDKRAQRKKVKNIEPLANALMQEQLSST